MIKARIGFNIKLVTEAVFKEIVYLQESNRINLIIYLVSIRPLSGYEKEIIFKKLIITVI